MDFLFLILFIQLFLVLIRIEIGLNSPAATRIMFLAKSGVFLMEVIQVNIQDSGQVAQLALSGKDAAGNSAPLDPASVPVYTLDNSALGTLSPDPSNPMGQLFTPSGQLLSGNIDVSVPAVNSQPALVGSLPIAVVAGAAVALALSGTIQAVVPAGQAQAPSGS